MKDLSHDTLVRGGADEIGVAELLGFAIAM